MCGLTNGVPKPPEGVAPSTCGSFADDTKPPLWLLSYGGVTNESFTRV